MTPEAGWAGSGLRGTLPTWARRRLVRYRRLGRRPIGREGLALSCSLALHALVMSALLPALAPPMPLWIPVVLVSDAPDGPAAGATPARPQPGIRAPRAPRPATTAPALPSVSPARPSPGREPEAAWPRRPEASPPGPGAPAVPATAAGTLAEPELPPVEPPAVATPVLVAPPPGPRPVEPPAPPPTVAAVTPAAPPPPPVAAVTLAAPELPPAVIATTPGSRTAAPTVAAVKPAVPGPSAAPAPAAATEASAPPGRVAQVPAPALALSPVPTLELVRPPIVAMAAPPAPPALPAQSPVRPPGPVAPAQAAQPSAPAPAPGPSRVQEPPPADPLPVAPALTDPPPPVVTTVRAVPEPAALTAPLAPPAAPAVPLPPARLELQLDGPRLRTTDQGTEIVSGRLAGAVPDRLVVYVNGGSHVVSIEHRAFRLPVSLVPGVNRVRAVAVLAGGPQVTDEIVVTYAPPPPAITLDGPADGLVTVGPDDPPAVLVQGRVEGLETGSVRVVVNGQRASVRVRDGRFRHVVPLMQTLTTVWLEPADAAGAPSRTLTIRASAGRPGAVLVLDWPAGIAAGQVEVSAAWRGAPDRVDRPAQPLPLHRLGEGGAGLPPEALYLAGPRAGAYLLRLSYRGPAVPGRVGATLLAGAPGALTSRPLRPVPLPGPTSAVLGRTLLPQAVLWEDDDWFTGQSQSSEAVTKFRFPDGVVWTERAGEQPR